jgi:rubredoxin
MRTCPRCGSRIRSIVEHVKVADHPEIAVPRWECTACDWAADHLPGDEPDV